MAIPLYLPGKRLAVATAILALAGREALSPRPSVKAKTRYVPAPKPPAAGRNEPCPCGSGRKYKACCRA